MQKMEAFDPNDLFEAFENAPLGKDGKPINRMKTGNKKQAYYGRA